MWLIEEYAINLRILFWFNPKIPPIRDDKIIENVRKGEFFIDIIKIDIGAIFCQVKINKLLFQFKPSITSGNHEWKGGIPNFNSKAENNKIKDDFLKISIDKNKEFSNKINEKISMVEANVWTIKYFIVASLE